jgi:hypothetical protein
MRIGDAAGVISVIHEGYKEMLNDMLVLDSVDFSFEPTSKS